MSWSISAAGKPADVVAKLRAYATTLTGQSRREYDEATEAIIHLVQQNYHEEHTGQAEPGLVVEAHGSGVEVNGESMSRECAVSIQRSSPTRNPTGG